ncbi:glycoside hydrolase family 35 protein [Terriglobus saanensis]|uniref:Beta-galactosidase n=1 Tax=Terriglobus saanensis (strain ATCC BAA-1853 / DSM 23119 / SP1PR4) TaxID=401053 RepID=E8V428_TERSS|nr:beta-galactosidase family protein [Terriglobus saanensis]ADV82519.1 glycoside hydrolase family 35 [Terriglobus saanensis SP1PR4]
MFVMQYFSSGTRAVYAAALLFMACTISAQTAKMPAGSVTHTFRVAGDHFELNGEPVQLLSGEMHYARIPREYWRARLQMAKAMGLNTVATYIFWNVHEPKPGVYDFSGNHDVAAFVKMAQEEGLNVILRAGPYACAEWEFGGYPSWLMKDPKMGSALRSNDEVYMAPVERWIKRLGQEMVPLLISNGGPIVAVQVENEYGDFGGDKKYLAHMLEIFQNAGFKDSFLYTVDPSKALVNGSLEGLPSGVNFGVGNAERGLTALAHLRPGQPLFASEYWPGWFDHWGHPHETRPIPPQLKDIAYTLDHKSSINIYMFHGGTSFGFMSGASWTGGEYLPDVTSYDYDAPLDEAGHPTPKFYAYRDLMAKYVKTPLPLVPAVPEVIAVPEFTVGRASSLWDHLPVPVKSEKPLTMEAMDQSYGYALYRKQLSEPVKGELVLDAVHDYALVYLNGKLIGSIDRRLKQDRITLATDKPARLDILVENSGRINSTKMMRGETKGITRGVTLAGRPLTSWEDYSLPMLDAGTMKASSTKRQVSGPHFSFGSFKVAKVGDTFLDVRALGKGALWINGHAMGRFWNVGPQETLFVPGPWLKRGRNDVVVFDLFDTTAQKSKLAGLTKPILDAETHEVKKTSGAE